MKPPYSRNGCLKGLSPTRRPRECQVSMFVSVQNVTFPHRRNRLKTHLSERIPIVKRCMTVIVGSFVKRTEFKDSWSMNFCLSRVLWSCCRCWSSGGLNPGHFVNIWTEQVFTDGYVVENTPLIIRGLRRSFFTGYSASTALKVPVRCISTAFPSFPLFIGKNEGTGCVSC